MSRIAQTTGRDTRRRRNRRVLIVTVALWALLPVHAGGASAGGHQPEDATVGSAAEPEDLTRPLAAPQSGPASTGGRAVVYFGIDDGPSCSDKVTWGMLDLFARHGARATWFVTGNVNCNSDALRAIVTGGHAVGSHTYGHDNLTRLSHGARLATFDKLQSAVTRHGGPKMTCYRPPYGATNSSVRASAAQRGMVEWLWNVDPRDWSDPGVSKILASFNRLEDGDVVVIHDGNSNQQTLDALRIWLPANASRFALRPLPGCAAAEPLRCQGEPATIIGTDGDDILQGTPGRDVIWGGEGDDTIRAGAGDDVVCGGPGDDKIYGEAGKDILAGGPGKDDLIGGQNADTLKGGPGADRLWGGKGADTLSGGPGADELYGGPGPDTLRGGSGADQLRGGSGADRMWGSTGQDLLSGGSGADRIWGNAGRDLLSGGPGADVLAGGDGHDTLVGGRGPDVLRGGPGRDTCRGGPGIDKATSCSTVSSVP